MMTKPGKKHSRLKIIVYSMIPVIGILFLIEVGLRVVYFQKKNSESLALTSLIKNWKNNLGGFGEKPRHIHLREWNINVDTRISPKPEELKFSDGLVDSAYSFRTDSNGFILPGAIHKDPELSICFLGGSTTECRYVSEEKRFPYLVGREIEALTNLKTNTFNSGRSGNHTFHSIDIFINKVLPLNPDIAILMHNMNDWVTLVMEGTYWNNNPSRALIIDPNIDYEQSSDEWKNSRNKDLTIDTAQVLNQFSLALNLYIDICRNYDITPVIMTQPSRFHESVKENLHGAMRAAAEDIGLELNTFIYLQDEFNATIRNVANNRSILLVDLAEMIPESPALLYDIVHYNNDGSEAVAKKISQSLLGSIDFNQQSYRPGVGKLIDSK